MLENESICGLSESQESFMTEVVLQKQSKELSYQVRGRKFIVRLSFEKHDANFGEFVEIVQLDDNNNSGRMERF